MVTKNLPALVIVLSALAFGLYLFPYPSSRNFIVFLCPLVSLMEVSLISALLYFSPGKLRGSEKLLEKVAPRINLAVVVAINGLQIGILLAEYDPRRYSIFPFLSLAIGGLFLLLGSIFFDLEKNPVVGFRTPWTRGSDENWRATHEFAARVWIAVGILLLFSAFWTKSIRPAFSAILVATFLPALFSFLYFWKSEQKPRR